MVGAPIPMWQMQIAFAIGLAGIYIGWRGKLAKMTGFYDLSGAFKTLIAGIIVGAIAASLIDGLILAQVAQEKVNIIDASAISLIIACAESAFALFILGRPKTVGLRASAPYGWTFGLGYGAMRSAHLNVRLFEMDGFHPLNISIAILISITTCVGHAMIASWQGSKIVEHERARTFFTSSFVRAVLIIGTVLSVFLPLLIILLVPAIPLLWNYSQKQWLTSGMTPAAAQAYRRTIRGSSRHEYAAATRRRGQIVSEEE
tara:strand:- start:916 stop:1692 length:777 start_codon:yes stop_codon:yes gene_type:complete